MTARSKARSAWTAAFLAGALVLSGVCFAGLVSASIYDGTPSPERTRNDCTTLAGAVTMWKAQNGSGDCPDMDTLVSDGQLAAAKTDAWGNAFTIECDGLTITVTSAGPDERMGTEDDIR